MATEMDAPPPADTQLPPSPTPIAPSNTINDAHGHEMAFVPAGEFTMGSEAGDTDEDPVHTVYLDAYYIDLYEVTNAQYSMCAEEGACSDPGGIYFRDPAYALHPVVYVDWADATEYCEWRDASLPTEAQWEKAARGMDGRIFPWGDVFDNTYLNFCDANCSYEWADTSIDDGYAQTSPVGSYPLGVSPYGLFDMAGNAWEWVSDHHAVDYYATSPYENPTGPASGTTRVQKGGGWLNPENIARAAGRDVAGTHFSYDFIGFRCAVNP